MNWKEQTQGKETTWGQGDRQRGEWTGCSVNRTEKVN